MYLRFFTLAKEKKKKIIYQYLINYFFELVSCLPSAVTYCLQEIFVPSPEDELFYIIWKLEIIKN